MKVPAAALVVLVCVLVSACGASSAMEEDPAPNEDAVETAGADEPPGAVQAVDRIAGATEASSVPPSIAVTTPEPRSDGFDVGSDEFDGLVFDSESVPVNGQAKGVLVTPYGWITPILRANADGWIVWTPCGRSEEVTEGRVIEQTDFVIDPGHGGPSEPGAVGRGGKREADLNLEVSLRIRDRLEAAGYSVVLTRHGDVRVPIVTRAEIARALDPKAFISVHFNAGTDAGSAWPGTEMYHQIESADSKRLAGLLYEEVFDALSRHSIDWVALYDAGVLVRPNRQGGDYYGVLRRPAPVTSVLAEFGYLSNPAEEEFYSRPETQEILAAATVRAVNRYIRTSESGSGFVDDPMFRGYGPSGAGRTDNCVDPLLQ